MYRGEPERISDSGLRDWKFATVSIRQPTARIFVNISQMRRAGMYVTPWHERRSYFLRNPRGRAYARVCRLFRPAFAADRDAASKRVHEALCAEAANDKQA